MEAHASRLQAQWICNLCKRDVRDKISSNREYKNLLKYDRKPAGNKFQRAFDEIIDFQEAIVSLPKKYEELSHKVDFMRTELNRVRKINEDLKYMNKELKDSFENIQSELSDMRKFKRKTTLHSSSLVAYSNNINSFLKSISESLQFQMYLIGVFLIVYSITQVIK